MRPLPAVAALLLLAGTAGAAGPSTDRSLTDRPGDPARGRAVVRDLSKATCLICHAMPIPEEPDHGDVGPPLAGVGARLGSGEIRQRIVDPTIANPATVMPAYFRAEGLDRVGAAFRGRTIYTAQEVEDVVAYLATLTGE
ncbi:MAG: sulfur oxidation c-type cytochrome SoxX [Rhodospirillales bacterium]